MGKKGSRRKTRWRTLSIGAPPGGEDEEEGLRNGYVKNHENDGNAHTFDPNGHTGYKLRRNIGTDLGTDTGTSGTSGYASSCSRSCQDESTESTSQQKIIFNEDEYLRITTPRQDVLFKKGSLSRRKPWAGNASTSATPSTTGSQSASHSTADGSETTEDQQLLDGAWEYPPVVDPGPQMGYETFYDDNSGYFYECPVMLVGPAPISAQIGPGVLSTMPCEPVPLRPIAWINPAFVSKLSQQPYCMMHYQAKISDPLNNTFQPEQNPEDALTIEELGTMVLKNASEACNETNGTGSASCSGSVAGEAEEQATDNGKENAVSDVPTDGQEQRLDQSQQQQQEQEQIEEETRLENGMNAPPFVEAIMMQQPVHISHVVPPPVHQPYMYPGHYMFGPPLVNVNGVTIQSASMIRTTDMAAIYAKRRKKKKRRKQKRTVSGNVEDEEEEEEYSSECDNGLLPSQLPWCPTNATTVNRPLNPECQEFQLRKGTEGSQASTSGEVVVTSESISIGDQENASTSEITGRETLEEPVEEDNIDSRQNVEMQGVERLNHLSEERQGIKDINEDGNGININEKLEGKKETDGGTSPRTDTNETDVSLGANGHSNETVEMGLEDKTFKGPPEALINGEVSRDWQNKEEKSRLTSEENLSLKSHSVEERQVESKSVPRRKYSKGSKIVREATPAPKESAKLETDIENTVTEGQDVVSKIDLITAEKNSSEGKVASEVVFEYKADAIAEGSNGDSGFESSQTKVSDYPITEAVTEWLRRANSPDVFITTKSESDLEEDDEEEGEDEDEPSKNLQGNPMPALSANQSASKFARDIEVKSDQRRREHVEQEKEVVTRKKRVARRTRKKSGERIARQTKNAEERKEFVASSSDSCYQHDEGDEVNAGGRRRRSLNTGDSCEFTERDSVADMRVASSSRMDSKRVVARRSRRSEKLNRDNPVENVDVKMRLIGIDNENEDGVGVRTFEKGEIVVSEEGKLLPVSSYEVVCDNANTSQERNEATNERNKEETKTNMEKDREDVLEEEEEKNSVVASLTSIEEPDVLECWEAETIEPVITPKRMLQSHGILYEGEAAEEDGFEVETENIERVQKYYRLARGSVEEEPSEIKNVNPSRTTVPNTPEQMIESFCSEEIPVIVPEEKRKVLSPEEEKIPIDEAFEVYESCYNGKPHFLPIDSNIFKSRSLYGQDGEGPIPCRAVCCNIQ